MWRFVIQSPQCFSLCGLNDPINIFGLADHGCLFVRSLIHSFLQLIHSCACSCFHTATYFFINSQEYIWKQHGSYSHLFSGNANCVTSAWINFAFPRWLFSSLFFSTKFSIKSTAVTWCALPTRWLVYRLERSKVTFFFNKGIQPVEQLLFLINDIFLLPLNH